MLRLLLSTVAARVLKQLLTGAALGFGGYMLWRYFNPGYSTQDGEGAGLDAVAGDFMGVGYQLAGALDGGGMNISFAGLAHIKGWEGFKPSVYLDSAGKPTIGFGHLIKPYESFTTITEAEAARLLAKDVATAENAVNAAVKVPLTQNEFDALVSFVYNVGAGAFSRSTMLKELNKGNKLAAQQQFTRWVYAGGKVITGLANRRLAEARLFAGVTA